MKKPVLVMGILMMGLFLYDLKLKKNGESLFNRAAFNTYSCSPVVSKLSKTVPANWKFTCKKDSLKIEINFKKSAKDGRVRELMYREMANYFIYIANHSPIENLERVLVVHMKLDSDELSIDAISEGAMVAKFSSITDPDFVRDHLKSSIKVKETTH